MSRTKAERFRDEAWGEVSGIEYELGQLDTCEADIRKAWRFYREAQQEKKEALAELTKPLCDYAPKRLKSQLQHPKAERARQATAQVAGYRARLLDLFELRHNRDQLQATLLDKLTAARSELETWERLAQKSRERIDRKPKIARPVVSYCYNEQELHSRGVLHRWVRMIKEPLRVTSENGFLMYSTASGGSILKLKYTP